MSIAGSLPVVVKEVPLTDLQPNPHQPRKNFDKASLQNLADSIDQHGLINPITVAPNPNGDGYIIVAGERRFRAHKLLKWKTIRATITSGNADELALIENIQRDDLNPIEEAEALALLKERRGYTQAELAKVVDKARSTVANMLGLNQLHPQIKKEAPTTNFATKSLLIELSKIKDLDAQFKQWSTLKSDLGGRTVREVRQEVAEQLTSARPKPAPSEKKPVENTRNYEIRNYLLENLISHINERGYTREVAAKKLSTSQPRLSDLFQKRTQNFTIDALINMFESAGIPVRVEIDNISSS